MSLEVLVSIGIAVEGLQFMLLFIGLSRLLDITHELGAITARLRALEAALDKLK